MDEENPSEETPNRLEPRPSTVRTDLVEAWSRFLESSRDSASQVAPYPPYQEPTTRTTTTTTTTPPPNNQIDLSLEIREIRERMPRALGVEETAPGSMEGSYLDSHPYRRPLVDVMRVDPITYQVGAEEDTSTQFTGVIDSSSTRRWEAHTGTDEPEERFALPFTTVSPHRVPGQQGPVTPAPLYPPSVNIVSLRQEWEDIEQRVAADLLVEDRDRLFANTVRSLQDDFDADILRHLGHLSAVQSIQDAVDADLLEEIDARIVSLLRENYCPKRFLHRFSCLLDED